MPTKTNKHVWDYLTYYFSLIHAPGFPEFVCGYQLGVSSLS